MPERPPERDAVRDGVAEEAPPEAQRHVQQVKANERVVRLGVFRVGLEALAGVHARRVAARSSALAQVLDPLGMVRNEPRHEAGEVAVADGVVHREGSNRGGEPPSSLRGGGVVDVVVALDSINVTWE